MSASDLAAYAYGDAFLGHDMPSHPENAGRLRAVTDALRRLDILPHLLALPADAAAEDDVALVHDRRYVAWLRRASVGPPYAVDGDNYLCAGSYEAATRAVGGAIACVDAVCSGKAHRAVALLRPPGHHARPADAYGFCLLNNVACAAAFAIHRLGLERVLVFDFDVHHGNGTQDVFYDYQRVLYVSLHQYPLFPMTGLRHERGAGEGEGYTINVPLAAGAGDATYAACVDEILTPAAEAYRPELVLVSAGYDGHWRDPIAHMEMTVGGFDSITRRLLRLADELCGGRITFCLEGGYDREVLAACVANLLSLVAGLPLPLQDPVGPPPSPPVDDLRRVTALAREIGRRK